jgi:hypothetical protein
MLSREVEDGTRPPATFLPNFIPDGRRTVKAGLPTRRTPRKDAELPEEKETR